MSSSDKYTRVDPSKNENESIGKNEIRVTTQGKMRRYISYATNLLQDKDAPVEHITLKAMGKAINKTVAIAEIIKRRIPGLHQVTEIDSTDIKERHEPNEAGLDAVETTRHVSSILISLYPNDSPLVVKITHEIGYQTPIPEDEVKPQNTQPKPRNNKPRQQKKNQSDQHSDQQQQQQQQPQQHQHVSQPFQQQNQYSRTLNQSPQNQQYGNDYQNQGQRGRGGRRRGGRGRRGGGGRGYGGRPGGPQQQQGNYYGGGGGYNNNYYGGGGYNNNPGRGRGGRRGGRGGNNYNNNNWGQNQGQGQSQGRINQ